MMATIIPTTYPLDPDADLDFGFDWGADDWLQASETIVASTWVADPAAGITLHNDSIVGGITTTWIKEIIAGVTHRITNSITTSSSPARKDDRSFYVKGIDR